jgi:hypothetical protein
MQPISVVFLTVALVIRVSFIIVGRVCSEPASGAGPLKARAVNIPVFDSIMSSVQTFLRPQGFKSSSL